MYLACILKDLMKIYLLKSALVFFSILIIISEIISLKQKNPI
jgi:hypothetical protein